MLRRSVAEELPLAIRTSRQEIYLTPSVSGQILYEVVNAGVGTETRSFDALTTREREVLQLSAMAGLVRIAMQRGLVSLDE